MINKTLSPSELILNPDGSIYHLNLKPGEIANTIITVGDPDRVEEVSKHFSKIETAVHKREFKTHTGVYKGKRLTVISTGIGTDNIDIVFNELDALVNIDFATRKVKSDLTQLNFIRIGTSGAIQKDIKLDSFLVTTYAIGFDSLLHYYDSTSILENTLMQELTNQISINSSRSAPYIVAADEKLLKMFCKSPFMKGITATNIGFYGPQGRSLRLDLNANNINEKLASLMLNNECITNLEMETSGIYGMAKLLGHRAISLNAILANRTNETFSEKPLETTDKLIRLTLDTLVDEKL